MSQRKKVVSQPPEVWEFPDFEYADIAALKAVAAGVSTPEQAKRALDWIINKVAGTYDLDYRKDTRDHAFVAGKRCVGLNLVTAINKLSLKKLKERDLAGYERPGDPNGKV